MQSLDLAVIGNCVVSALIDKQGRHVWHCHPRLDADPIFCTPKDELPCTYLVAYEGEAEDLTRRPSPPDQVARRASSDSPASLQPPHPPKSARAGNPAFSRRKNDI